MRVVTLYVYIRSATNNYLSINLPISQLIGEMLKENSEEMFTISQKPW